MSVSCRASETFHEPRALILHFLWLHHWQVRPGRERLWPDVGLSLVSKLLNSWLLGGATYSQDLHCERRCIRFSFTGLLRGKTPTNRAVARAVSEVFFVGGLEWRDQNRIFFAGKSASPCFTAPTLNTTRLLLVPSYRIYCLSQISTNSVSHVPPLVYTHTHTHSTLMMRASLAMPSEKVEQGMTNSESHLHHLHPDCKRSSVTSWQRSCRPLSSWCNETVRGKYALIIHELDWSKVMRPSWQLLLLINFPILYWPEHLLSSGQPHSAKIHFHYLIIGLWKFLKQYYIRAIWLNVLTPFTLPKSLNWELEAQLSGSHSLETFHWLVSIGTTDIQTYFNSWSSSFCAFAAP